MVPVVGPALIAGLPACSACVCERPPLLASAESSGLLLIKSPAPEKPQVLPLSRLLPPEMGRKLPPQLAPLAGLATMLALTLTTGARAPCGI